MLGGQPLAWRDPVRRAQVPVQQEDFSCLRTSRLPAVGALGVKGALESDGFDLSSVPPLSLIHI